MQWVREYSKPYKLELKYKPGYDVKFFASDWPGLAKNQLFDIIKGIRPAGYRYGEPRYFR